MTQMKKTAQISPRRPPKQRGTTNNIATIPERKKKHTNSNGDTHQRETKNKKKRTELVPGLDLVVTVKYAQGLAVGF